MQKIILSVALAVLNEEDNLNRCLSSVKDIAGEIVVVDGGSTDKTVEIAKRYNAKIIKTNNPPIFHINKQKALDACIGDWILQLDADEFVSVRLSHEVQNIIQMTQDEIKNGEIPVNIKRLFERHQMLIEKCDGKVGDENGNVTAFFIPRLNYFLGGPIRYGGAYPDGVIRLVKRGYAKFPCISVHEQIEIKGQVSWLENDLLHYSNSTLKKYISAADKYTGLMAEDIKKKNPHNNIRLFITYLFIKPISIFIALFIRYKGIMDGWRGFLFALFSSLHFPVAYIKYLKLKK